MENVQLSLNANVRTYAHNIFSKLVLDNDYPFLRSDIHYQTDSNPKALIEQATYQVFDTNQTELIIPWGGCLVYINIYSNNVNIQVATTDSNLFDSAIEWIKSELKEVSHDEPNIVPITFWSNSAAGPQSVRRRITVPTWPEIEENYTKEVRDKLSNMMTGFKPAHGGQLVIWEGSPGTGKTYSLRALANSWRKWADFHYVVDPEEFFGSAAYMIQVILQDGDPYLVYEDDDVPEENTSPKEMKWKVLILEDCGELLSKDAKERVGQAVARLLNVVDGMIGQGLKLLVLVTTNEPVKKFDPAIIRPGRCAAMIQYHPFTTEEAEEWLINHNAEDAIGTLKDLTIAELFGATEGYQEIKSTTGSAVPGFGFGG